MRVRAATAAATVSLLACAGDGGQHRNEQWAGTMDTLDSGTILVRNPDAALWRPDEAWQVRERFRIGALEGDGPDVFGEIRDIELGLHGEIYILDSQASEIRAFGRAGEHLLTFARSGQGPGELNRPAGIALDSGETLWVMNWGNGRYSGFDPRTGELKRETPRLVSFAVIPWPGRFDLSDRLIDTGLGNDGEPVILYLDSEFVPHDTLPMPRADEANQVAFQRGNMRVMTTMVPFAPQPLWAPHPSGGIVIGEGGEYRLHHINFRGDTTVTIEVSREPIRVTGAERDCALEPSGNWRRWPAANPLGSHAFLSTSQRTVQSLWMIRAGSGFDARRLPVSRRPGMSLEKTDDCSDPSHCPYLHSIKRQ